MKLRLAGLTKTYGERQALDEVSLEIDARSLVLIGPSGGGKSTLLRVIAGLEAPDAGELSLNGERVVFTEAALRVHRRTMGVVFQAFNLFPHLSALKNITLPLRRVHGLGRDEAEARARETLRRFRLEDHAHHRPAELSGGQQQRVAIARAIAIKPRVLLFDEPTSALDPEMTAEVLDVIEELKSEGHEFVLITHEMSFARVAADEVVFIAEGRVKETGPAEEVFDRPRTESCREFLSRVLKY